MDSSINWFQPEQEGPANDLWLRLWQTQVDLDNMHVKDQIIENDLEAFNNSLNNPHQQHLINSTVGSIMGKSERTGATVFRRRNENRASIRGLNRHPEMLNEHGGCPWQRDDFHYEMDIRGLHHEIEHFYEYMSPTKTEHRVRGDVIKRIENIIVTMWPETQVQVFGSYRTRLYLPTSDIDLVVIGKWSHLPFRTLEREFLEKDIAEEGSIKVLDKASVPIVKLTDKRTDVKVDISFNMCNGVRSADLIQSYLTKYPVLPKLVYVLKHFLLERDLNEVFTGGISSYSLILMCISFLQLHRRSLETTRCDVNLGVLLIEFLELYGRKFNYMHTGIRIKDGGRYISKEEMQKDMLDGHRPSLLCIEDPLLSSNDIGRSSYGVLHVRRAFDNAYSILTTALHRRTLSDFGLAANINRSSSLLGRILLVTDEVVRYRRWVEEKFSEPAAPFIEKLGNARMSRSHSSGSTSSDSGTGSESIGSPTRETSPNNNCNNHTSTYNNRTHPHNDANVISSNLTTGNTVNYYQQQQLQQQQQKQQKLNQTHISLHSVNSNNIQSYNTHNAVPVTTSTSSSNNGTNTYHHSNSVYAQQPHHPGTNTYAQQQQRPSGQSPSAPKYNVRTRRTFQSKYNHGMGGQYGAYSSHQQQHQRSGATSATQVASTNAMESPHSGGGLTYQSPLIPPSVAGGNASLQCNNASHMGSTGATVPSASMSKPRKHHHTHNVDGSAAAPVTSNATTSTGNTGGGSASTHHNHQQIEVE